LQRAWKAAGFGREPIIKAPKIDALNKDIEFAVAGGENMKVSKALLRLSTGIRNQQLILQTQILNLPSASDASASHAVSSQTVFG
jgi:hypothetical protein